MPEVSFLYIWMAEAGVPKLFSIASAIVGLGVRWSGVESRYACRGPMRTPTGTPSPYRFLFADPYCVSVHFFLA